MLVRCPLALLLVLAVFLGACGGSNDDSNNSTAAAKSGSTAEISGAWTGTLTQAGLPAFKVAVAISNGTARVAYTGIDCAGDWKLTSGGDRRGTYVFTETINQGAGGECEGTGTVRLAGSSHRLSYRFEGGGVSSQGVLRRARTPELAAVFREAGIQGPA